MDTKKVKTVWIVKYKDLKDIISSAESMLYSKDSVTGVEKNIYILAMPSTHYVPGQTKERGTNLTYLPM